MIRYYNLLRPIYKATARYGHVGVERPEVTWEKLEKVEALRRDAGLKEEPRKAARARK
jgi:S-adenosylmethionine synthetase